MKTHLKWFRKPALRPRFSGVGWYVQPDHSHNKGTWSLGSEKEPSGIRSPVSISDECPQTFLKASAGATSNGEAAPEGIDTHSWKSCCEKGPQIVLSATPPNFKELRAPNWIQNLARFRYLQFIFLFIHTSLLLHYCQWACKSLLRPTCESQTQVPWKLNSLTCSHFSLWCQSE